MARVIRVPELPDTVGEAALAAWHANVGESLAPGVSFATLRTDQGSLTLKMTEAAVLLARLKGEDVAVDTDAPVAVVGTPEEALGYHACGLRFVRLLIGARCAGCGANVPINRVHRWARSPRRCRPRPVR